MTRDLPRNTGKGGVLGVLAIGLLVAGCRGGGEDTGATLPCEPCDACDTGGPDTGTPPDTGAPALLGCADCHVSEAAAEAGSAHRATLDDVAAELAEERAGQTPDEVLNGDDPEDCIACHAPTAVFAEGGMSESEALAYFFTTTDGAFSADTVAQNADDWPHVACEACHEAPDDHPAASPSLAWFDARAASYQPVSGSSALCGNCHGSEQFADTDHLTWDAWAASGHGDDQQDVADELAEERAGESPHEVVTGDDPEDCIACHAPTAVLAEGGMSEEAALAWFFTTTDGVFTADTAVRNGDAWPDVACTACHDPHSPDTPAYFNSSTRDYEAVAEPDALCGRCHGSLRFASTDHLSYDLRLGTEGIGVDDDQLMPGVSCVDCHMSTGEEDSFAAMTHGHAFQVVVEEDGGTTDACLGCHPTMDSQAVIAEFQAEFAALDATAAADVEAAEAALAGAGDAELLAKLEEARHDLALAEGDESGGFHNHDYAMALLQDAEDRAREILAAR